MITIPALALADVLALYGHRVHVATNGRAGATRARELKPDVVFCDIGLPDVNGYDLARALRRDDDLRSTYLVALSGYAQPEDKSRAAEAGFDAHIAKPADIDELAALVAQAPSGDGEERPVSRLTAKAPWALTDVVQRAVLRQDVIGSRSVDVSPRAWRGSLAVLPTIWGVLGTVERARFAGARSDGGDDVGELKRLCQVNPAVRETGGGRRALQRRGRDDITGSHAGEPGGKNRAPAASE